MSRDPDSWYEEEYWEEIGRQEDIGKAIKNLSQQPIRDFLGTYGDAIDERLDDIIAQARYARSKKFDASGKFVTSFGANMFNQPHGFYVDNDGNVWVTDERARNGKGGVAVKFSPQGQVLMTLGKAGMPGNTPDMFNGPSSIVVASLVQINPNIAESSKR